MKTNKLALFAFLFMFANTFAQEKFVVDTKIDDNLLTLTKNRFNDLPSAAFEAKVFNYGSDSIPYRFLKPKEEKKGQKYPLIITFHNSSRIGSDNEKQLEPLTKYWLQPKTREKYPCYVIAPQFSERSSTYTTDNNGNMTSSPSPKVEKILDIINLTIKENPNIDTNRIYLVGYSMGASTAQNLFVMNPSKFAALVSIAGVPDLSNTKAFQNKPIWLVHGAKDTENPYKGSVTLANKLANDKKLLFTTFSNLDHNNITAPVLLVDQLPNWLFSQKLTTK